MHVTFDIPDAFGAQLAASGKAPARTALEALLVDAYRTRMLSEAEIKRILGFATRMEVHQLLSEHGVPLDYTVEDLEHDRETLRAISPIERSSAA